MKNFLQIISEATEYGHSASHKDKNGYTVTVSTRKTPSDKLFDSAKPHDEHFESWRHGRIEITHPNGQTIRTGYWMDHPEKGWTHNGVDLHKDHFEHVDKGTPEKSVWRSKIPVDKRLEIEAKHQATAYDPLKKQFAERIKSIK
jgi:hypothetical protein